MNRWDSLETPDTVEPQVPEIPGDLTGAQLEPEWNTRDSAEWVQLNRPNPPAHFPFFQRLVGLRCPIAPDEAARCSPFALRYSMWCAGKEPAATVPLTGGEG